MPIHTYTRTHSECLFIHTRTHTHAHIGMRRTRDNLLLVHGRTHVHTYIHKYTCGLAHARRCCQPHVCLSLSRLHGQPSPGANISVRNVRVCIRVCISACIHMSNIGGRNSKAVCFQVEPIKQSKRRASGRMFRMHTHL